jgi:hypothetical protein
MAKLKAGGGINSRQRKEVGVRTGTGSKGVQPGYAGQLGTMKGDHATSSGDVRGDPRIGKDAMAKPAGNTVKFGNEVATNVGKGGPGTGRNLYGSSGTNRQYGAADPGQPLQPGPADRGPRAILGRPGQKV